MLFPELTEDDIRKMIEDDFKKGALCIGPSSWERYAKLLKRAADITYDAYKVPYDKLCSLPNPYYGIDEELELGDEDIHLIEIYYLLMGFSIENLVKAIIMMKHPENLDGEVLTKIDKHETFDLLNENGITEFKEYDAILVELAEYVKWKGRYPVPLRQEYFSWSLDTLNPKDVNSLYEKIFRRLNLEKRLKELRDTHKIDKSIKEFLDIQKEIISFMNLETEIRDIVDIYRYPWPLIREVLKDYCEDLSIEDPKSVEISRKIWIYENP